LSPQLLGRFLDSLASPTMQGIAAHFAQLFNDMAFGIVGFGTVSAGIFNYPQQGFRPLA
jgi:hypothetical protein